MDDTDLAGPLVFCLAFGGFLLLVSIWFGSRGFLLPQRDERKKRRDWLQAMWISLSCYDNWSRDVQLTPNRQPLTTHLSVSNSQPEYDVRLLQSGGSVRSWPKFKSIGAVRSNNCRGQPEVFSSFLFSLLRLSPLRGSSLGKPLAPRVVLPLIICPLSLNSHLPYFLE